VNGKAIVISLLICAAVAGVGLWYSIEKAYYERITGVTEVVAYGDKFPVSNYDGIDADTSPLKMRACFTVDWDYFPTDEFKDVATPLNAPSFFSCFDAGQLTDDLQAGAATAILANENVPYGFDTYIVQYPDGRAYMWRQINICGESQFSGDDLPAECPDPEGEELSAVQEPAVVVETAKVEAAKGVSDVAKATYQSVSPQMRLLPYIGDVSEVISASDVVAVANAADPLSFQGCFKTPLTYGLLTETYETHTTPTPTSDNLDCFDAAQVQADLNTGNALAFVGEKNIHPGIDRVVAVYEDGRAFAWHQKAQSE